jgi:hypothetical protein
MLQRTQQERKTTPSAVSLDSQSVKKTSFVSLDTGIDADVEREINESINAKDLSQLMRLVIQ